MKRFIIQLTLLLIVTTAFAQRKYSVITDTLDLKAFDGAATLNVQGGDLILTKYAVGGTDTLIVCIDPADGSMDTIKLSDLGIADYVFTTGLVESNDTVKIGGAVEENVFIQIDTSITFKIGDYISQFVSGKDTLLSSYMGESQYFTGLRYHNPADTTINYLGTLCNNTDGCQTGNIVFNFSRLVLYKSAYDGDVFNFGTINMMTGAINLIGVSESLIQIGFNSGESNEIGILIDSTGINFQGVNQADSDANAGVSGTQTGKIWIDSTDEYSIKVKQ